MILVMNNIPRWIVEMLKASKTSCSDCGTDFDKSGIMAIGIRALHTDESKDGVYVEYECPSCSAGRIMEFQHMTIEQFVMEVISEVEEVVTEEAHSMIDSKPKTHSKNKKAKKKVGKSKITQVEQDNVVEMMNECNNWEEFLKKINAPMDLASMNEHIDEEFTLGAINKDKENE
jgi:DNA-directed RNA polymerase subunit RPC12/RpoP